MTEKKKKKEEKTGNWIADKLLNNQSQKERWMKDKEGWDCDEDEEDWTDWKTREGGGRKRRMSDEAPVSGGWSGEITETEAVELHSI